MQMRATGICFFMGDADDLFDSMGEGPVPLTGWGDFSSLAPFDPEMRFRAGNRDKI